MPGVWGREPTVTASEPDPPDTHTSQSTGHADPSGVGTASATGWTADDKLAHSGPQGPPPLKQSPGLSLRCPHNLDSHFLLAPQGRSPDLPPSAWHGPHPVVVPAQDTPLKPRVLTNPHLKAQGKPPGHRYSKLPFMRFCPPKNEAGRKRDYTLNNEWLWPQVRDSWGRRQLWPR